MRNDSLNKARAIYYKVFSYFFVYTTDINRYFDLLSTINVLKENALDESSQKALENIYCKLEKDRNILLLQEYDDIFNNPSTKNIRTSASFYSEGIESGKKRVEMQNFLAKTKIRRDEKNYSEYEDSIGFIFTVLNKLTDLESKGYSEYTNTIHCIFEQILNDFVDEFAKEIYEHKNADIYKDLVIVLKSFIEFERVYLQVSKPTISTRVIKQEVIEEISEEEKARRARNKALRESGPKKQADTCSVFVASEAEIDI